MLNFIDKLDEEQTANAEKVAIAARRAGVDPRLAVAIAFQESRLRSNPPRGSSGEIGMMQVMPATGKGMGFDEKQLSNLDQNIEAGVRFLRKGLDATGNDPQLAAIYYNGGPGAIQALTSGKDPDPRVFNYLRSINSYGAFEPRAEGSAVPSGPDVIVEEVVEEDDDEQSNVAGSPDTSASDAARNARIQAAVEEQDKRMAQIVGGGLGAMETGRRIGAKAIPAAARAIGEASESGRLAARARAGVVPPTPGGGLTVSAPTGAPGATASPAGGLSASTAGIEPTSAQATRILQGTTGDAGTTGRARMSGFATETSQTAAAQKQAYETASELKNLGLVAEDAPAFFSRQQGFTSSPSGVLMPRSTPAPTLGPRGPEGQRGFTQPMPPVGTQSPAALGGPALDIYKPPVAKQSGLQTITQKLSSLAQPVVSGAATVGKYVAPPLALAGAAGEGSDVVGELRKDKPDYTRAGLSGLSAAAGLAALYPPYALGATAVGGTAALINYLRQKQKEGQAAPSIDYAAP